VYGDKGRDACDTDCMQKRIIGELLEYPTGSLFESRTELSNSGVHRPTQGGICGGADDAAESICISGGYIDDEDLGGIIIYTGQGAQNRDTKRQVADQKLTRGNEALRISFEEQTPVRVVRGPKPKSTWTPNSGYRYDGLYWVTSFWHETGIDGYKIYRYRLEGSPPSDAQIASQPDTPRRRPITSNQIIRDAALAQRIKKTHNFTCQICNIVLNRREGGPYSEAAHIKPLGKPFHGPDVEENILCLCPNHHKLFDSGAIRVNKEFEVIEFETGYVIDTLNIVPKHFKESEYLKWHWEKWS